MSHVQNPQNESRDKDLIAHYCEAFGVDEERLSVLAFTDMYLVAYMQPRTDIIIQVTDARLGAALVEVARILHGGDIDALQRCLER